MTKKQTSKKTTSNNSAPASITGDHFTLEQVANECVFFQTENEELQVKKSTVADHFMSAAKLYIQDKNTTGEDMAKDHPFLVACKDQENLSKSSAAGVNQWDVVPSVWTQIKSNIKAAYNMGMDVSSYEKEGALRKDLNEARKEKKKAEEGETQVDQALSDAVEGLNPEVSLRIFALVQMSKDVTEAQSDEIVRVLDEAIDTVNIMKELAVELAPLDAVG